MDGFNSRRKRASLASARSGASAVGTGIRLAIGIASNSLTLKVGPLGRYRVSRVANRAGPAPIWQVARPASPPSHAGWNGAAARLPGRRATHAKAMTAPGHPKLASIATAGLIRPAVRLVVFVASSSSAGRVITRPTRRRKSWTSRDPVALRPDGRQSEPIRPFRREGPPGPGSPGPATSRHDAARAPGPCPPPSVSAGLGCLRTPPPPESGPSTRSLAPLRPP